MPLPDALIDNLKRGNVAIFLGSGALIGANLAGKKIPLGDDLRDILSDKFLKGKRKNESLSHIADLSISAHSLFDVQDFIRDYFSDLTPGEFHLKIPSFAWKAIFTTNYDRLIELTYEKNTDRLQTHMNILSNADMLDETSRTTDIVPVVKMHGCITRTHDPQLALILTIDQYNESQKGNRENLFKLLYEAASSYPIVFVGHALQDANIRAVLLDVHKEVPNGQRHYLLKPGMDDYDRDYWGQKKITALDYTFEAFITEIDQRIDITSRTLAVVRPNSSHEIEKKFAENGKASNELLRYLTDGCEYISQAVEYKISSPDLFYRGADLGWYPISEGLCITRNLELKIQSEIVNKAEAERASSTELVVIKGEAGSGKTTLLRQVGWNGSKSGLGVFLWIRSESTAEISSIAEIVQKTRERVYILWDDASLNSVQIHQFYSAAKQNNLPVTIITAERHGEWNTRCGDLDDIIDQEFELHYLSESEISDLITKLQEHDALGSNLASKTFEERIKEFCEISGRQLLVALYEATKGEPFEEIIYDEYQSISNRTAQEIYRTVCTLNRIRVPVRAGLISRIHDVTFDDFKSSFFKPLEKIVLTNESEGADIHYKARHPEIADIVFKRALANPEDRFNEYIRILKKLNTSYESDRISFRSLIRAKSLRELFPSHDDIKAIYSTALASVGDDSYLLQQMANYERIRPNGNLNSAIEWLKKAQDLSPYDASIPHTLALVWQEKANQSDDFGPKTKFRAEARTILERTARKWGELSHISAAQIQLSIDDLVDLINEPTTSGRSIDEAIRTSERLFIEFKRKFPSDGYIHQVEAEFAKILEDNKRVVQALEKSFEENNRDPFIASRLAKVYQRQGDAEKAIKTIKEALERRPGDQRLNFQYAEHLRRNHPELSNDISYHYRRAYTPGDANFEAQFWHARYLSESPEPDAWQKAQDIFMRLRSAKVPFSERIAVKDATGGLNSPTFHYGQLVGKQITYGFVRVDGSGRDLFCSQQEVKHDLWPALRIRDRLKFNIGFSYQGVVCFNVLPA